MCQLVAAISFHRRIISDSPSVMGLSTDLLKSKWSSMGSGKESIVSPENTLKSFSFRLKCWFQHRSESASIVFRCLSYNGNAPAYHRGHKVNASFLDVGRTIFTWTSVKELGNNWTKKSMKININLLTWRKIYDLQEFSFYNVKRIKSFSGIVIIKSLRWWFLYLLRVD